MLDTDKYIKQGIAIVRSLIREGKLQAALSGCNELLKINPYDRSVQEVLREIEEQIVKENDKKVDSDISATMHLWKEGRWEDLLKIYGKLHQYAPSNKRLSDLITKLYAKLSDNQKKERDDFISKALSTISGLLKEKQFGDAIQACNELLEIDPINDHAKSYLQTAQNKLIERKLDDNRRILEGADLDRILEFYNSLLAIRPDHQDIQRRALQVKAQIAERKILADRIHLNESIARMKALFKNAEYEKVIQSAEEIERLDAGNVSARIFRKKALQTMKEEIDDLVVKKLKEAAKNSNIDYKKSPAEFVKI